MTKKEFKKAMCQGLGRCQEALRSEPEKYRDIVLWACQRDIAYDTQCEGTRAYYVYKMACAYEDVSPFVEAAAAKLDRYKSWGGWELAHLTELLSYFAEDGNVEAQTALDRKYRELYNLLLARKRRRSPCFVELWDMERMGVVLAKDWQSTRQIISDFGRLYQEKSYFYDGDFDWLYARVKKRYSGTLRRAAREDPYIACFLQREKQYEDEWRVSRPRPAEEADIQGSLDGLPEQVRARVESAKFRRKATQEEIAAYARAYREERDTEKRKEALWVFINCPYPDDPAPIIDDALSEDRISGTALMALEQLRHPAVRAAAMERLTPGEDFLDWFCIFLRNYEKTDGPLLQRLVEEIISRGDPDEIHSCGMKIMNMFDKEPEHWPSRKLLPIFYEATPCAECRFRLLRYMGKFRMLTEEILEECLEDSNSDIQNYAKKLLKRRQMYRKNMKS